MVDATGTVEVVHDVVVRVADAGEALVKAIEQGGASSRAELDAVSALSAAGALLAMAAANTVVLAGEIEQERGRHQDDIDRAVGKLHDAHCDELADALGEDAADLMWRDLLDLVRERAVPFGVTVPVSALLLALGDNAASVANATHVEVPAVLDRVRFLVGNYAGVVGERNAAIANAQSERARINMFGAQLADALGIPIGDSRDDQWGTPSGLDALLTAAAQLRARAEQDVLDVGSALDYLSTGANSRELATEGRKVWATMMGDIGDVRAQLDDVPVRIAAALGLVAASPTLDGALDLVRQQAIEVRQLRESISPADPALVQVSPAGPDDQPSGAALFSAGTVTAEAVVHPPHQTYSTTDVDPDLPVGDGDERD